MSSVGKLVFKTGSQCPVHCRCDGVTEGNIDFAGYIYAKNTVEKANMPNYEILII